MSTEEQAKVDLFVNGRPAVQAIEEVKAKIDKLTDSIEKAKKAGDEALVKTLSKDLQKTRQQLRYIESGAASVNTVMKQLNKATPDDLNRALKFLNREIKYIERGTPAWDEHVAKIKMVKAELEKVNSEMRASTSFMDRMKNAVNNWGASLAAGAASVAGLVAAAKKAVQTYAEMQQEEANVRKYTGMTEEEVNHLNDAFKKMDTRTSREELNKLAQEAGRLGLQSEEDVLGFVKAADKINVALDDLGDGATLTLSKLTDIFGDKQALGTERSLLAVGSVINELSQNSTAAAPYLAEFGQRLAGVGAQAHMTIPEIMGFGAVLDSQGQKLEMSSTALSKVIMNLFKNPEKIAKATGLAVEEFSETCKRSTNEGLLMLLDRLHELGGIDTLAPVFADMGENGARASAVLAALAGNVDMVRQQQEAANVAFQEAVSIDKEFEVQNTTVQAGLEKARKGFTEMAVTLGKELMPIVSKVISSTSMTMRLMLKVIQFVKEYRAVIIGATTALVSYYALVKLEDAWNAFTGGIKKATAAVKAFNAALKAHPYAAVTAAILGVVAVMAAIIKKRNEMSLQDKVVADAQKEINKQYVEQKSKIDLLNDTLHDEKLSLEARKKALDELKSIVPDYHASLTNEGKLINDNADAIDNYTKKLERQIQRQVYQEKLMELYQKKMQAEENLENSEAALTKAQQEASEHSGEVQMRTSMGAAGPTGGYENSYSVNVRVKTENLEGAKKELSSIEDAITKIKGKIGDGGLLEAPTKTNTVTPDSGAPTGGGGEEKELKDKLKELADIRKTIMAQDKIAYLQGVTNYEQYQQSQLETEIAYQKKVMAVHGEGTTGYLEAEAAMLEAQKKLKEHATGQTIEAEQQRYSDEKAVLQQHYADGQLSAKAYQLAMEQSELDHLQNMVNLYEEGSEERIKAQEKYNQRSLAIQQKHVQEHEKIMEKMKKSYFSMVESLPDEKGFLAEMADLNIAYDELSKMQLTKEQELELEEAFQQAKFDIAKKYNMQSEMDALDSAQATYEKMVNLFQSKGAKKFISAYSTLVNGLNDLFSGVTDFMEAELAVQTAQIEKRYDAEIAAAGNNKNLVAKLEKEKEAEIAKMKNEAADKEFKMNIAMAIAQGALSAINAWNAGVGAGFPAGLVLGPIMLAMSLAATGLQIAAMTKQHEAAMAQGYAAGGYTAPGGKYQPAGIVHAGEWVASQELLANPTAAATIAQLDQAQKTNTIGQLSAPPVVMGGNDRSFGTIITGGSTQQAPDTGLVDTIQRLNQRLNEPFINVNTITGDRGILRAQRRYEQLMRNKGKK